MSNNWLQTTGYAEWMSGSIYETYFFVRLCAHFLNQFLLYILSMVYFFITLQHFIIFILFLLRNIVPVHTSARYWVIPNGNVLISSIDLTSSVNTYAWCEARLQANMMLSRPWCSNEIFLNVYVTQLRSTIVLSNLRVVVSVEYFLCNVRVY